MAKRKIAGLRIVITGASQGIGRAIALKAYQQGGKVLAAARSASLLEELKKEAGANPAGAMETVVADVTESEGRKAMLDESIRLYGGADVLVNNAGVGATGHFAEGNQDRLRKIMEVNYFGLIETTRVFIPEFKKRPGSAIVNISSIAGKRGIPARGDYSASKFAVQGFSDAIRAELAKDGIDVLVVCPGLTQTNFSKNMIEQKAKLQMDHLRGMTAEEVARHTLRTIETGRDEISLTFQGKLLAFVARFLPGLADRVSKKRVRELFEEEMVERQIRKREVLMQSGKAGP
ncbi:MAG: SDR family oxidoreductase [Gemmataceae bacterium]|nr:SDR family oxidoreductase [Gemmataceae bacterium]